MAFSIQTKSERSSPMPTRVSQSCEIMLFNKTGILDPCLCAVPLIIFYMMTIPAAMLQQTILFGVLPPYGGHFLLALLSNSVYDVYHSTSTVRTGSTTTGILDPATVLPPVFLRSAFSFLLFAGVRQRQHWKLETGSLFYHHTHCT